MARIHKIAVFISHIYGDYQREVCQGIIDKATSYGYHVDIFTTNDEQILGNYSTGEFGVLKIPNSRVYDGVILSSGTYYLVPELGQKIVDTLRTWNCPVVDVNTIDSPFATVLLDNNAAIKDLIKHLAVEHSYSRIFYLGSSVENTISDLRCVYYSDSMKELGLSDNVRSASADYSIEGIRQALDSLLLHNPDAIVCYNDRIAYTVMSEMTTKGISIPDRVAVTGCDNLEFGQNINPTLTTVTFPTYEMGERAFMLLLEQLDHTTKAEPPIVKAVPKYGSSCGCKCGKHTPPIIYSYKLKDKVDRLEAISLANMHMSSSLKGMQDIDVGMDRLYEFITNIKKEQGIEDLKECYLCLYSDWDQVSQKVQRLAMVEEEVEHDKIILKLGAKDGARLSECTFSNGDSLPEFIRRHGSDVYVFTPLFFGEHSFGYLCLSYEHNRISYPFSFVSWLQTVNSMLESISTNKNMQLMMNKLEDIYSRDNLTGLYNLQRFNMLTPELLKKAKAAKMSVFSIVLDLDYLKKINDKYGHAEGNFAIKVLGQAINSVCTENIVACRFGGDEFYMVAMGLSVEETQKTIFKIQHYLEHYNDTNNKPFSITVSGGFAICAGYTDDDLNDAFKIADHNMYQQKQLRHLKNPSD